jgi:hypothetical protein
MPGPPPHGDRAATPAERAAAYRARRKAAVAAAPTKPPVVVQYRRPADRRSQPQQWADAVQTLADLLDRFQEWRDNLPSSLANSATAEALDAVLELRGYVDELQAVELPKGSDATDGTQRWRYRTRLAEQIALATSGAVHIRLLGVCLH